MTRIPRQIEAFLDRYFKSSAALLVLLLLLCSIGLDIRKKMWIDELYTLHMARQASLVEIVRATLEGCDGAPPIYSMLVHLMLPWVHSDAVVVRLPSSLGFCGMAVCLLAFCRRRLPALYSFVAVALVSNACLPYATEGRCYGLVLCCATAALLCWQAAVDERRRAVTIPLLAFSLACMTALHYYSLFFILPLFLAEMVRWRKSGRLDLGVLAAMLPSLLVLGLHLPFIQASGQFQKHYWAPASFDGFLQLSVLVIMLAPLALLAGYLVTPRNRTALPAGLTLPEWVVCSSLFITPFCIFAVSTFSTHVFLVRYVLWAEAGTAVLVAAMLYAGSHGSNTVSLAALCLLLALLVKRESDELLKKPVLREGESVLQALNSLPESVEPIVVADHHVFMELGYYAPHPLRERLIYPVSRELDLRYLGADTGALLMSALSKRSQLPIQGYDAVLRANPQFVLAALPRDYLPSHLLQAGYRVVPIGSRVPTLLYQVESPVPVASQPLPAALLPKPAG